MFQHSVQLTNMKPDTTYYFKIVSRDVFGKTLTSDYYSLHTKPSTIVVSKNTVVVKQNTQKSAPVVQKVVSLVKKTPVVAGYTYLPYTPATLYRVTETKQVYAVFKGQKYLVPDEKQFLTRYGYQKSDIKIASQAAIDQLPFVHLVKSPDSTSVYYIYNQTYRALKLVLPNESIFTSYSGNAWSQVVTMDMVDINMFSDATLVQTPGSREVYRLEENTRRLIPSEDMFNEFGFIRSDVVQISAAHLQSYSLGNPLASQS